MGDWSKTITLISYEEKRDEMGVLKRTGKQKKKKIFCDVEQVNQQEFFSAAAQGYKATFRATVHRWEYSGQEWAEYKGVVYKIYRGHDGRTQDDLELYLMEKQGR